MHVPTLSLFFSLITKQSKIKSALWGSDLGSSVEGKRRQGEHFQNSWKRTGSSLHWPNHFLLKYKRAFLLFQHGYLRFGFLLIVLFLHSNKKFWQRKRSFLFMWWMIGDLNSYLMTINLPYTWQIKIPLN